MLEQYYFLDTAEKLKTYISKYYELVKLTQEQFGISAQKYHLQGDHIGVQALSATEFNTIDQMLKTYCKLKHAGIIHSRRNNIYVFNTPLDLGEITLRGIEIFEPKPDAIIKKLKPGIEHIAFYTPKFDELYDHATANNIPIDKCVAENGSKFFKTQLINMIEIEYRNDFLDEIKK